MVLAARGLRNMDAGTESVEDAAERAELRRQARKVHVETLITATVLTAAVYFLPLS